DPPYSHALSLHDALPIFPTPRSSAERPFCGSSGPGRAVECCPRKLMPISKDAMRVESDIARAWTLPARYYADAGIFAAEKEKIFSRTWQVVGHSGKVVSPGDYFTTEL